MHRGAVADGQHDGRHRQGQGRARRPPAPIGNTATVSRGHARSDAGEQLLDDDARRSARQAHLSLTQVGRTEPGRGRRSDHLHAHPGQQRAVHGRERGDRRTRCRAACSCCPTASTRRPAACTVTADNVTVNCTFASIPSGESRVVTIAASVPAATPRSPTPITNIATVTSSGRPIRIHSGWTASVDTARRHVGRPRDPQDPARHRRGRRRPARLPAGRHQQRSVGRPRRDRQRPVARPGRRSSRPCPAPAPAAAPRRR